MSCRSDGQLINGDDGGEVLVNEENAQHTTTAVVWTQIPNSQLVVTAGNWVIHFSINVRISNTSNLAEVQCYNLTLPATIGFSSTADDQYKLYSGVKYLSVASGDTIQWWYRRVGTAGTVYVQNTRIVALMVQ